MIMTKEEQVEYWIKIAEHDLPTAQHLFENGYYVWCLFIGHLILEKILKAHYVNDTGNTPPKIHDLVRLAEKTKLNLTDEQMEFLDRVNDFNIESRYPDYKFLMYKTFDK
jgi:HEPN domain-containing protein